MVHAPPRRVPWRDNQELDHLRDLVYTGHLDARRAAIHRLVAWQAISPLPQALEAVLSILVVQSADQESSRSPGSDLRLRHEYSLAVLRAVNGLVDPYQDGLFARSVASIAAQIGLPNWLVELRHASTHEDLPSLDILRHAADQLLKWYRDNFFSVSRDRFATTTIQPLDVAPLKAWLKQYRTLALQMARDESLRSRRQNDMRQMLRNLERWIASSELQSGASRSDLASAKSGDSLGGRMALEALSDELLHSNNLSSEGDLPSKTHNAQDLPSNLTTWLPLLRDVQLNRPTFFSVLLESIFKKLGDIKDSSPRSDILASWSIWIIHENSVTSAIAPLSEIVLQTLQDSGNLSASLFKIAKQCTPALLDVLPSHIQTGEAWLPDNLGRMSERQEALRSWQQESTARAVDPTGSQNGVLETLSPGPGWSRLTSGVNWSPCPLGTLQPSGTR